MHMHMHMHMCVSPPLHNLRRSGEGSSIGCRVDFLMSRMCFMIPAPTWTSLPRATWMHLPPFVPYNICAQHMRSGYRRTTSHMTLISHVHVCSVNRSEILQVYRREVFRGDWIPVRTYVEDIGVSRLPHIIFHIMPTANSDANTFNTEDQVAGKLWSSLRVLGFWKVLCSPNFS